MKAGNRIGIVGLGTIGRRVMVGVLAQPDLNLVGAAVRRFGPGAIAARARSVDLYSDHLAAHVVDTPGGIEALARTSDVIVDCTQAGNATPRIGLYQDHSCRVIVQGGEEAVSTVVSTYANFATIATCDIVRVSSCNMTGMIRILGALTEHMAVEEVDTVLVKCSTDPDKAHVGPIDGAVPKMGRSRHAAVVSDLFPGVHVFTRAVSVPMSAGGHVAMWTVKFGQPVTVEQVISALVDPRIVLVTKHSTSELFAADEERYRLEVWNDSLQIDGRHLRFAACVPQESITIPETIDAIRAQLQPGISRETCTAITNTALGLGKAERQVTGSDARSRPYDAVLH